MSLVEHWQKVLCRDASSENNLVYIVAIKLLVVAKVNKIKLASFICNDIYTLHTFFDERSIGLHVDWLPYFQWGPSCNDLFFVKLNDKIYYNILYNKKKVRRNIKNITNVSAIIVFVNILEKFNRFITKIKEKNSFSLWIHKMWFMEWFSFKWNFISKECYHLKISPLFFYLKRKIVQFIML